MAETTTTCAGGVTTAAGLPELVERREVLAWCGMRWPTLARRIKAGRFPRPAVRLSARRAYWRRQLLLDWLDGQQAAGA